MSTITELLESAAASLRESAGQKAQYTGWNCVSGPAALVDWLVDRGREVTYRTFARQVEVRQLPTWWEGMPRDWSATWLKTELPSGQKAWVAQHSGIEYLFTHRGDWDQTRESRLARKIEGWLADQDKYDWVSQVPRTVIASLRRRFS